MAHFHRRLPFAFFLASLHTGACASDDHDTKEDNSLSATTTELTTSTPMSSSDTQLTSSSDSHTFPTESDGCDLPRRCDQIFDPSRQCGCSLGSVQSESTGDGTSPAAICRYQTISSSGVCFEPYEPKLEHAEDWSAEAALLEEHKQRWLETPIALAGNYRYAIRQEYGPERATAFQTLIVVENHIVVGRQYLPNGNLSSPDAYVETTVDLGSHRDGASPVPFEGVYDSCMSALASVHPRTNLWSLEFSPDATLVDCTYLVSECKSNCIRGFDVLARPIFDEIALRQIRLSTH